MKQLRFRTILFLACLAGIYVLSHYLLPGKLTPLIFVYALILSSIFLALPQLLKIHTAVLIILPVGIYIGIKVLFSMPIFGNALPRTIIESSLIIITCISLIWLRASFLEFEEAVAEISIAKHGHIIEHESEGQQILYREVRRARNHQRPLSLIALGLDEKSIKESTNRLIQDAQQLVCTQIAVGNVSRILSDRLEDCDIIMKNADHFIIVLPETLPEDLPGLKERLRKNIADQLGVEIKIGSASIPGDGFTLDGLVEKATLEMECSPESMVLMGAEQLFVKNKVG